jgi:hypothetical protein
VVGRKAHDGIWGICRTIDRLSTAVRDFEISSLPQFSNFRAYICGYYTCVEDTGSRTSGNRGVVSLARELGHIP